MFRKIYLFFRNTSNDFIQRNTDLNKGYEYIQWFLKTTLLGISRDENEYLTRNLSRSRICWVLLVRVVAIVTVMRFGVSALLNKQSVRELLFDVGFMVGPPRLISSAFTAVSLSITAIGLITVYQELTFKFHFVDIAHMIITKQIKYPLNNKNECKFNINCNLMFEYLLPFGYLVMVIFVATLHFIFTFLLYLTFEEKLYSFIRFVIYNILAFIFCNQCFAITWADFIMWFTFTTYPRYKFREINANIEISLKYSNINLLMYSIKEHNYVEILTKKFNHVFFRMITFIIYYSATIGFQLILFCSHHKESHLIAKLIACFSFFSCFWAVLMMNFMSTGVIRSAHKSYPKLYKMISKGIRMSFRQRWKLLSFIEKLSGPPIGFYCYDLFPMNSYEFYQYLFIAGSNYILIMGFFN